jgi:hypothetical protein
MARWIELLYNSTGTTAAAETKMTDFTPTKNARLLGVIIYPGGQAATSLVEGGYVKMSCPTFAGVDLYVPFWGNGLRTAPAPKVIPDVTPCVLAVQAGTPVKGYYYFTVTPTTPQLMVYGVFEG